MLRALASGETDAEKMSELARRSMKRKQARVAACLEGRLTQAQRWVLAELLDRYDSVESAISRVEAKIGQEVEESADPFVREAVKLLDTIPGVAETRGADHRRGDRREYGAVPERPALGELGGDVSGQQ